MAEVESFDFQVRRNDLGTTRFVEAELRPDQPLGDGDALLRIERFGLTANNITYGLVGDAMRYWEFFPASDGWGRIPVWGFARVVQSHVEGVRPGDRVFGYLPISSYLRVRPARVGDESFMDGSEHRRALPPVYQRYTRATEGDPTREDLRIVLSPLFGTAFLLDDWIADQAFFDARLIVFASASSRTALGSAYLLRKRPKRDYQVIGLTSAGNREFCEQTGYYDRVLDYGELTSLPATTPALFVDMASDSKIVSAVHGHFGAALRYSCVVGMTHKPESMAPPPDLVGPTPQFFFAPTQGDKRAKEWGAEGFAARLSAAQEAFYDSASRWLSLQRVSGRAAIESVYHDVLRGKVKPSQGLILSL